MVELQAELVSFKCPLVSDGSLIVTSCAPHPLHNSLLSDPLPADLEKSQLPWASSRTSLSRIGASETCNREGGSRPRQLLLPEVQPPGPI